MLGFRNRTPRTRTGQGQQALPALPLYGVEDAELALQRFVTRPFGEPFALEDGAKVTFRRAGHILGAATVVIERGSRRIMFSGDLGGY